MTGLESFAEMLKHEIAPELRLLGLRGSGRAFALPSPIYWATLGFQTSHDVDPASIRFTVNLSVIPRHVWDGLRLDNSQFGARPQPNTRYRGSTIGLSLEEDFDGVWEERIGFVLPHQVDHWWVVRPHEPTGPLAHEVVVAVRDYALPAMRERMVALG